MSSVDRFRFHPSAGARLIVGQALRHGRSGAFATSSRVVRMHPSRLRFLGNASFQCEDPLFRFKTAAAMRNAEVSRRRWAWRRQTVTACDPHVAPNNFAHHRGNQSNISCRTIRSHAGLGCGSPILRQSQTLLAVIIVNLALMGVCVVVATRLWPYPSTLLRFAAGSSLALALVVFMLAASGLPIYRWQVLGVASRGTSFWIAVHGLGHHALLGVMFVMPLLLAAAARHKGRGRRSVHLVAATGIPTLWFVEVFTGYILPKNLPHPIPRERLSTVLRFAILHVLLLPALLALLLVFVAFRHIRRAKSASDLTAARD